MPYTEEEQIWLYTKKKQMDEIIRFLFDNLFWFYFHYLLLILMLILNVEYIGDLIEWS